MDNGKAELGLIGLIVIGLPYTIKHQNISV